MAAIAGFKPNTEYEIRLFRGVSSTTLSDSAHPANRQWSIYGVGSNIVRARTYPGYPKPVAQSATDTLTTSTAINFAWEADSNDGTVEKTYELYHAVWTTDAATTEAAIDGVTPITGITKLTHQVTGLTPNAIYGFTVIAKNKDLAGTA